MGWYQDLEVRCIIHPDFLDFYRNEYLHTYTGYGDIWSTRTQPCECHTTDTCMCYYVEEYVALSKAYRDIIDGWISTDIGRYFQQYTLDDNILSFRISKKVNKHSGHLWKDYESFMRDVVVPTTTEVLFCEIYDDNSEYRRAYTDMELREKHLYLKDLIRSVHHTWIDGVIAETRVIYKRGIPARQQLDLERLYER